MPITDDDPDARDDMALASLFGGLALANAKLGAVHGFAGVLGGMYDAPHGAICAALLPHVTEVNIRALQSARAEQSRAAALRRNRSDCHRTTRMPTPMMLVDWISRTGRDA